MFIQQFQRWASCLGQRHVGDARCCAPLGASADSLRTQAQTVPFGLQLVIVGVSRGVPC